jgi:uncharacterized SAM-binding protein YcdF (DUF218 family)
LIYIHKALPLVISPLGLLVALLLLGIFLRRFWPFYLVLIFTLIFSWPPTARLIWRSLESTYPYQHIDRVEQADAVVVLSGMLGMFETEHGYVAEWGGATDRFFAGIDLIKAGKADKLIFTRGQMPWSDSPPEGEVLRLKALNMGISEANILLTGKAANTADEATQVKKLLQQEGLDHIILVTSSFHMPRSKLLFDNAGINNVAYPTDFQANTTTSWLDMIPSAKAFKETSSGLREYIGRMYYWLRF